MDSEKTLEDRFGPDLELLIRRSGRHALTLELHAADPKYRINHRSFPPVELERDPGEYVAALFKKVEESPEVLRSPGEVLQELEDIGSQLFQEVVPPELGRLLVSLRGELETLLIQSKEPWIPWELLRLQEVEEGRVVGGAFLCEAFATSRWLHGRPQHDHLPLRRMAVIVPRDFAHPGVGDELAYLEGLRGADREVERIPAQRESVRRAFEEGLHDAWHFSGHGVVRGDPERGAIVLENHARLMPHNLSTATRHVGLPHPLVFFNACHTGRSGMSLTGIGGWAKQFLSVGAGAFIGTYWAVEDEQAPRFARAFYESFLSGTPIAEAFRQARLAIKAPGDPSWLAYTLYAHPLASVAGSSPRARASRVSPEVLRHLIDARTLIRQKSEGFVGRQWIFEAMDRFIAANDHGYFRIFGDPGAGKTALLAELVESRDYVHHFNVRGEGITRPDQFLGNVCAQLIRDHAPEVTRLGPEAVRDASFLNGLLEQIARKHRPHGRKLVLVVDALDEASAVPSSPDANVLCLPMRLPEGVFIVVTARRVEGLRLHLDCPFQDLYIVQNDERNILDVRIFVEGKVGEPGIRAYIKRQRLSEETFVDELVAKSQGNFMYLHHVVPAITGEYRDRDFSTLPVGLVNYYEDHWRLIRKSDEPAWFEYKLPILAALTVVREPVSIELIRGFSGVEKRSRIREVLKEWNLFLYVTEEVDDAGPAQKRYRIYHASFQDFVAAKEEVADERVDLAEAHRKIAKYLMDDLVMEE